MPNRGGATVRTMSQKSKSPLKVRNNREGKLDTVGERITDARKARGWTKKELARRLGVSKATVSDWENDKIKNLKMAHLIALSDETGYSIPWLALKRKPIAKRLLEGDDESELIALYRSMKSDTKRELLATAQRFHRSDHGDRPTQLAPFPPQKVPA